MIVVPRLCGIFQQNPRGRHPWSILLLYHDPLNPPQISFRCASNPRRIPSTTLYYVVYRPVHLIKLGRETCLKYIKGQRIKRAKEKRKREKNPPDTRLQSVIPVAYFPRFTERRYFHKILNNAKTGLHWSNISSELIYFVKKIPWEAKCCASINKNDQSEFFLQQFNFLNQPLPHKQDSSLFRNCERQK